MQLAELSAKDKAMKKTKHELVTEFRTKFGLPVEHTPRMLTPEELKLHAHLLEEEARELIDAKDIIAVRDYIGDMLYFLYGLAVDAGIAQITIDADFAEIHRSNMTKMWTLMELTDENFKTGLEFECPSAREPSKDLQTLKTDERRYIVRDRHGKIVKSPSYEPAKLV